MPKFQYELTELTPNELAIRLTRLTMKVVNSDESISTIEKFITDFSNEHEHRAIQTKMEYLETLVTLTKRNLDLFHENMELKEKVKEIGK